jgi:hypothetical protein
MEKPSWHPSDAAKVHILSITTQNFEAMPFEGTVYLRCTAVETVGVKPGLKICCPLAPGFAFFKVAGTEGAA